MSNNDTVRPGPQRWKRAVDAALAKPESHHAKLLFERLNRVKDLGLGAAYWVVEKFDRRQYYCSDFCTGLGMHLAAYVGDRMNFSTHDDVIAAIVGCRENDVIRIGWANYGTTPVLYQLDPEDLPRTVKCFTCGGRMSRETTTSDDPLVDFSEVIPLAREKGGHAKELLETLAPLAEWERDLLRGADAGKPEPETVEVILAPDGSLLPPMPVDFMRVELTAREHSLFMYVPQHLRHTVLNELRSL